MFRASRRSRSRGAMKFPVFTLEQIELFFLILLRISVIIAMTQSKWMRPALMTLALLIAALGVTGCHKDH